MELITYNGVELKIVSTNYVNFTPVYNGDGSAYLGTDWDIDVICHVHPYATSYHRVADNEVQAVAGETPGHTINAIRKSLETPHAILTITAGGETIIDSPGLSDGVRMPCDASGHGPICSVFSIKQIIGIKHFICHCRFQTRVNDNNIFDYSIAGRSPVASNVWTVIEDIDDLLYPVRTIAGQAVLRADVMRRLQLTANSFRNAFFFPVPNNFQRESAHVELSTDGTTLTYTIRDEGKCYNLGAESPVRRFEGYMTGFCKSGGAVRPWIQTMLGFAEQGANPINVPAAVFGLPGRAFANLQRNLNQYHVNVRADMWGARDARKGTMFDIGTSLCLQQLKDIPGGNVGLQEFVFRSAMHEKYISIEITQTWGDDLALLVGQGGGLNRMASRFRANDSTLDLLNGPNQQNVWGGQQVTITGQGAIFASQSTTIPPFTNPPLGGTGVNAGTQAVAKLNQDTNSLTKFITQLLMNPQQIPTTPTSRYVAPIRES